MRHPSVRPHNPFLRPSPARSSFAKGRDKKAIHAAVLRPSFLPPHKDCTDHCTAALLTSL